MSAAEELTDFLVSGDERFEVDDLGKANWAARKLAYIDAKQRDIDAAADAEIARIEEWRRSRKAALASDRDFFSESLLRFHRNLVAAELERGVKPDKVTKTLKLIAGVEVARRQATPSVKVDDPTAVVEHVKVTGEAFATAVTTWNIDKAAIKKQLLANQVVPGAYLALPDAADEFGCTWSVKVKASDDDEADDEAGES